jgi:NitT/TauT family transport system substrate-binding protein
VLSALARGARLCKDAPEAAREIVAKAMKTDATKLKELWPSYRFNVTLDQSLLLALEDETRWAIKNKLTGRTDIPNYLNYIYLDALLALTPAAVTVIH